MQPNFETNVDKFIIKGIINILEQDGDEASDGECIDQIVEWLRYNNYKVCGI